MTPEPGEMKSFFFGVGGTGYNTRAQIEINGSDVGDSANLDTLVNTNYGVGPGASQITFTVAEEGYDSKKYDVGPVIRGAGREFSTLTITFELNQYPDTEYATYPYIFAMKHDGTVTGEMIIADGEEEWNTVTRTFSSDEYAVVSLIYQGEDQG